MLCKPLLLEIKRYNFNIQRLNSYEEVTNSKTLKKIIQYDFANSIHLKIIKSVS